MALGNLADFAKSSGYLKEIPFSGGYYEEVAPVVGGDLNLKHCKPNFWEPPLPIAPSPTPAPPFVTPLDSPTLRDLGLEKDPHGKSPNSPGAKLDAGKIRPWLCIAGFSRALNEVARVTTKGAEKYTPNGWAEVPDGATRYMDAFGRHLIEYGTGKVFDDGPKGLGPDIYHKAQMIWNLLASLELELREKNDNN